MNMQFAHSEKVKLAFELIAAGALATMLALFFFI
jgi:hypothetical protein